MCSSSSSAPLSICINVGFLRLQFMLVLVHFDGRSANRRRHHQCCRNLLLMFAHALCALALAANLVCVPLPFPLKKASSATALDERLKSCEHLLRLGSLYLSTSPSFCPSPQIKPVIVWQASCLLSSRFILSFCQRLSFFILQPFLSFLHSIYS